MREKSPLMLIFSYQLLPMSVLVAGLMNFRI